MLKGVNKHVVEVVDMESEYFEKAILFLRAGRPDPGEGVLRQRAGEYLRTIKYRPRQGIDWQKALLAGRRGRGCCWRWGWWCGSACPFGDRPAGSRFPLETGGRG